MKALVTGANGFVGRALCAELRRRGHDVTAVVRRAGSDVDADRVAAVGEIGGATAWDGVLEGIDVVFHLAAHVHVLDRAAARDLARFREVNTAGTETLARAAASARVRRFVFLSTVAIHGADSRGGAFREDDAPHPVTAYGTSKAEAEARLRDLARETAMEVTILRAPLVYGPGVEAKFLQLLGILRRGLPLPFGLVKTRRSMMYIDNLVDVLILTAESPAAANETFLVADDEQWSTAELVRELAAAMDRKARLLPVPRALLALAGERIAPLITSFVVDTTKSRERLGWRPRVSASEGLRQTVRWYRSRR